MSLPSSHILPAAAFRHIGFMVMFMSVMSAFCALGFVSVKDITKGWLNDIENTLNIEIPSYDISNQTVLSDNDITNARDTILSILKNDPIITNIDIIQPDPMDFGTDSALKIPAPIFMTLSLRNDRARNAENRIIEDIQNKSPLIIIRQSEAWEKDIQKTAMILKLVFGGLALSVFLVTSIILSAVIRTQIKANKKTIELIHLMGASSSNIATLFQKSILKPTFWGCCLGLLVAVISLSPLMALMGLSDNMMIFYTYCGGIFLSFIILAFMITRWTVMMALRRMP